MLPTKYWADMTWRDFQRADMSKVVAVLPVAAIEQHGPHLPVGVDSFINEGYLKRAIALTPHDLPALFLPLQSIGKSNEHIEFPGTLTLSLETVARAWSEIGDSVARAGCRKLIFINSHGGNVAVLDAVTRDLRVRHRMLAVNAAWHRLGLPEGLFSTRERTHGIHGGDVETSIMLAARPETVRIEKALKATPATIGMAQEFKWLGASRPAGFAWMTQDLHESGALGDATLGTAAKGEAALAHGAQAFVELLREVNRFDLARLKEGPLRKSP